MRNFFRTSRNHYKSDALTVYSAGPGSMIRRLAENFTQATGIDVNLHQETTGKIMDRLDAEAQSPQADMVISASWDSALELERRQWLLPLQLGQHTEVPGELKSDHIIAQGVSILGLIWNEDGSSPPPQDWTDLIAPAYKNLVTTPDPTLSGASAELLLGLQNAYGDQLWVLLEALKNNGMTVSGANAQALAPVLRGSHEVVFGGADYIAHSNIKQGASLRFIVPASGTITAPRPMMILNTTRRADQARAFIDYMLSDDGQALVSRAGLIPVRADDAAHPLEDIVMLPRTGAAGLRRHVVERFSALFSGSHY